MAMQGKVVLDMSMSLDGFIAGPGVSSAQPMGEGGMRLHDWLFGSKTEKDTALLTELVEGAGAVIVGGYTYAVAIEDAWEGVSPFTVPALVVSGKTPERIVEGFSFVNDGIELALQKARAIAGNKNVWIMGGANLAQQFIKAGLIDEIYIHLIPVLLGAGTPLFVNIGPVPIQLEQTMLAVTPAATHFRFRVVK